MVKPDYIDRIRKLRERMRVAEIDALMVSEPHNIFYLCGSNGGYTGARVRLVVGAGETVLIIDKRYLDETLATAVADTITGWTESGYAPVIDVLKRMGAGKAGFEATDVSVKQYERMTGAFEGIQLVGVSGLVEPIREVKDEYEVQRIARAAALADEAFDHILNVMRPGVTEAEIGIELDCFMRRKGAERTSFDTIVASGIHSAVPHSTLSTKPIEQGDFVTLDFGAVVDGYHSDMTRTVVVGKASERQVEIYETVKKAQEAALSAVAPGKVCKDLDALARDVIADAGYGEDFVHNLGHGVGLQVHEAPTLGKGIDTVLRAGMVVTVEPGVYVSGFGGVRIEDLVVVTSSGYDVLSHSTKELIEL